MAMIPKTEAARHRPSSTQSVRLKNFLMAPSIVDSFRESNRINITILAFSRREVNKKIFIPIPMWYNNTKNKTSMGALPWNFTQHRRRKRSS